MSNFLKPQRRNGAMNYKKTASSILFTLFLTLSLWVSLAQYAHSFMLHNIRFGTHEDKTRIVLEISEKTDAYRAFALQDPNRIVIDLPLYSWDPSTAIQGKQNLISTYRFGTLDPKTSRLVFVTKTNAHIKNVFFLPPLSAGKPHRMVIDIAKGLGSNPSHIFGTPAIDLPEAEIKTPKIDKADPPITPDPYYKKVIVIDAGHGGKDPGAISKNKVKEKHITLAIAKRLQATLNATGRYKAILTRTGDYYIKLRQRVNMARQTNADLFISIHADSLHKNSVRGSSIYTLSETASDKESARLAERENLSDVIAGVSLEEEVDEVADILIDLAMRDTMNQSKMFANLVVEDFGQNGIKLLRNTHRFAGFAVLKAPDIPSILIETGYLSNDKDASLLTKASHQEKLAKSITQAINRYFSHLKTLE